MKCTVCGAEMRPTRSDLPFKTADRTIVILKSLPVLQCENCTQYLIEDGVLAQVDRILATSNGPAELQIIAYAAESPTHEGAPALSR
jgi:YgiT-type zinc finger domain-containing protein